MSRDLGPWEMHRALVPGKNNGEMWRRDEGQMQRGGPQDELAPVARTEQDDGGGGLDLGGVPSIAPTLHVSSVSRRLGAWEEKGQLGGFS
jgi:hypothetical protein